MSRITLLAVAAVLMANQALAQFMRFGCDSRGIAYPSCSLYDKWDPAEQRRVEAILKKMAASRDQAAKELSDGIDRARQRFFRTLPNGPGRAQAETEFQNLLDRKDHWFLAQDVPDAFRGGYEAYALPPSAIKVDGGIRPLALTWFGDWVHLVKSKTPPAGIKSVIDDVPVGPGQPLAKPLEEARITYEQYRLARDWAEFAAQGRNVTDNPEDYVQLLLSLVTPWPQPGPTTEAGFREHATRFRDDMAYLFGRESLSQAARRLMSAPKDRNGILSPPLHADGRELTEAWPALLAMLGETSHRNAVLMILVFRYGSITNFHAAEAEYQRLVAAYGEKAVQDAGDTVRRAAKKSAGVLADIRVVGVRRNYSHDAFEDLLEANQPKGYARAIIAFHDQLASTEAVDAAYAKLSAAYGDNVIADAARRIAAGPWPKEYQDAARRHALGHDTPAEQYGLLMATLSGSAKLQPVAPAPAPSDLGDYPPYLAWAKFKPGAVATYAETTWISARGQLQPAPGADVVVYSYKLQSLDGQGATVENAQATLTRSGRHGQEARSESYPARVPKAALAGYASAEYGADTLEVNGKTYECRWIRVTGNNSGKPYTYTTWNNDTVPGGIVLSQMNSGGAIKMKILQPFVVENIYGINDYQKVYGAVRSVAANSPFIRLSDVSGNGTVTQPGNRPETPATPPPMAPGRVAPAPRSKYTLLSGGLHPTAPFAVPVIAAEDIDLASDDDTRRFRTQTAAPVLYQGDVVIPAGADVFVKVIRKGQNAFFYQVALTVDTVVLEGKQIPVQTNQIARSVRITRVGAPAPKARSAQQPLPAGTATLPAGTRLQFSAAPSQAR